MLRITPGFTVETPTTLDEVVRLLATHGDQARLIAGGTDVMPNLKHGLYEPGVLISLAQVTALNEVDLDGPVITLGAGVTIHRLATDPTIGALLPSLASAAQQIAGPQLRRMGTLGGNLCLDTRCVYINQPADWRKALGYCIKKDGELCHVTGTGRKCVAAASNDTAPVCISLGASVKVVGPEGTRTIEVRDLYINDGVRNLAIAPDEVVVALEIPRPAPDQYMAFQKLRIREAIDYPMLDLALSYRLINGEVRSPMVVVNAIAARPRVIKGLPEGALGPDLIKAFGERAFASTRPLSNIDADLKWRREMVPVLVRRAFEAARPPQQ